MLSYNKLKFCTVNYLINNSSNSMLLYLLIIILQQVVIAKCNA